VTTLGATWQYLAAAFAIFVLVWVLVYLARVRVSLREGPAQTYIDALRNLLDGDLTAGARGLRETILHDTDNVDAYVRLGDLMRRSGYPKRALQIHQSLLQRRKLARDDMIRAKESLYKDYKQLEEPARAIEILKEIIEYEPQNKSFRKELMKLYEKRGMWNEAIEAKRRVVDSGTEEGRRKMATYQADIGMRLLEGGRREDALRYLKSALKSWRESVPALLGMGDVSYSKGDLRDALSYWRRVIEISPKYAFLTLDRMEKALFHQGKFSEITELYKDFLSRNQENVSVHDALARIYVKMGETESAVNEYRMALEIDPDHLPAKIGLARLDQSMGHSEDALRDLLSVAERLGKEQKKYYCASCGHKSTSFHWVCPKCGETESFVG
jgi:lipopolysaccharide biosynthesis regulator YciM